MVRRAVVDTSVLVSALRSDGGAAREVVRRCLGGWIEPQMGNALFTEIEDVFARSTPFQGSAASAKERDIVLDAFFSRCRWVEVSYLWRPNLRDEADNHVIELAVASGTKTIVTHNLRDMESGELAFPSIRIVGPGNALAMWETEES
ncbi:putative toxin-antitoxin system toxin component, PIN family [Psychromarinibacter sp. C21-152]|uniref:Toxin-antitoxin system toxin component, PIN family n=1 Tax=Psychromarinibacter sediminicola TaxID=3033385 RepID=A0AAE3NUF5_9RHOB|nr:putative toxin-antitoxin system toxin component, PIN family [Psychromarinibacter sediminicola]MDF0601170.1 putative toxin-antitoxin system toxin component, PIN family [Psychromarinibacter sediminicola]